MTSERRFEQDLPDLLADLYLGPPPDYRHDIVQLVARTPQRRAWMFLERWIPMSVTTLARQAIRPLPWRSIGLVALLALLLVAAIAFYAGSTQRRVPPPFGPAGNGSLVLAEDGDIFLVDFETGAKTLAIGGPAADTEPSFSRDGTQVAFFREAGGVRTLWLADDRGAAARQLSTDGLIDFSQIEWSPDGRSILLSTAPDGIETPAIVPTDGSAAHVVDVNMPAESPIWLPGGREILFRGVAAEGYGLFAVKPDGADLRPIVPVGRRHVDNEYDVLFYAPSPDATEVAFQLRDTDGTQKIFITSVGGGPSRTLTTAESARPMWSPDGTWIAFFSDAGLYVVRADGTQPERQVRAGSPEGLQARWSPDSLSLLYVVPNSGSVLVNPIDGATTQPSWTATELPDWQRLPLAR